MVVRERAGQGSPLPTDPDRARTSLGWRGREDRDEQTAGQVTQHSSMIVVGRIVHLGCLKAATQKSQTWSDQQFGTNHYVRKA